MDDVRLETYNRKKVWIVQDDSPWKTAETAYKLRTNLLERNPNLIIDSGVGRDCWFSLIVEKMFPTILWVILIGSLLYCFGKFNPSKTNLYESVILSLGVILLSWYGRVPAWLFYFAIASLICLAVWFKPIDFRFKFL
jgi:hypothetical protein